MPTAPAAGRRPRTLQDYFRTLVNRPDLYARRVVATSPVENHRVRCDCGRYTAADMLLDVRGFDLNQRATFGLASQDFLCDACVARVERRCDIAHADFVAAIAPADDAPAPVLPPLPPVVRPPLPRPSFPTKP